MKTNLSTKQRFYINNADIFGKYFEEGNYLELCYTNIDKIIKTLKERK